MATKATNRIPLRRDASPLIVTESAQAAKEAVVIPVITLRKPPAPRLAGLDQVSVSALRAFYALALNAFEGRSTAAEIEAVSTLRLRPYVGQYKAEVLAWLRGEA